MRGERALAAVSSRAWAMEPGKLAAIVSLLEAHASGAIRIRDSAEERAARVNAARSASSASGSIALIPVYGVLAPRMNMMSEFSGGTSVEQLANAITDAATDPKVSAIVLDVDSPGGDVQGVREAADVIRQARESVPVVAIANHVAASGGYWLASQATELIATPSALVGSIGVYTMHEDESAALESEGVKVTLISAGEFKTEGNPYEALTDEARASIQARIEQPYRAFLGDVAAGRGITASEVATGYGRGRVVTSADALAAGMIDRVGTMKDAIRRASELSNSTSVVPHGRSSLVEARQRQRERQLAALGMSLGAA